MQDIPIINKKAVRTNRELRKNQKEYRKKNGKGKRKPLKNYIGKLVRLSEERPIKECIDTGSKIENKLSEQVLIDLLENEDLRGLSSNGFPIAEKLKTLQKVPRDKRILIINGVECEPGLLQDEWLIYHKVEQMQEGIHYIKEAFGIERAILATKKEMKENLNGQAELVTVSPRYPMGEEHFLIQELIGIPANKHMIPASLGILNLNVQTVYQIARIVRGCYKPGHYITIADMKTGAARITYVTYKENILDVLTNAFGDCEHAYAGGGLLFAHKTKKEECFTSEISFAAVHVTSDIEKDVSCKKCGGCTKRCPVGIDVKSAVLARQEDKNADLSPFHMDKCMQCGTCTYFCHAGKNVTEYVNDK